ncbi:MAG: response regulator [Rhodospirillaceae bacterium]|nr:response regulator [Rhodospirillaceae bacterium]
MIATASGEDISESAKFNGASVLVVDDNPQNVELLLETLDDEGFEVRAASSGPIALNEAKNAPPDLILLDIMMPGMDGYEVCQALKADERLQQIPVIFVTSLTDSTEKVKAFAAGGVDYVTKPIDLDEVVARVRCHLTISKDRDQLESAKQALEAAMLAQATRLQRYEPVSADMPSAHAVNDVGEDMQLTERERECLYFLARGHRNDRIAEKMDITVPTVNFHVANARKKLNSATREQALAVAVSLNLVSPHASEGD